MRLFDRIFGKRDAQVVPQEEQTSRLRLADPNHIARKWIDAASSSADQFVSLSIVGDRVMFQTANVGGKRLLYFIEKAIERAPDDPDLLVAKSGALFCAMQYKTAEDVIDRVLSLHPDHFEARQRKEHWEEWDHLFKFPPWSTDARILHPVMAEHLRHEHAIQLVRDGLQIGIAVVEFAQSSEELSERTPSKWVPVWSDTPYGTVVAHYAVVEDNPADPWKQESFLTTWLPDDASPSSAYRLLQRMSYTGNCFIVLTDGHKVFHNSRYVFPSALRSTLQTIVDKIVRQSAKIDLVAHRQACQWHMSNFDLKRIR